LALTLCFVGFGENNRIDIDHVNALGKKKEKRILSCRFERNSQGHALKAWIQNFSIEMVEVLVVCVKRASMTISVIIEGKLVMLIFINPFLKASWEVM
jgi:hypothetical protein